MYVDKYIYYKEFLSLYHQFKLTAKYAYEPISNMLKDNIAK